MSGRVSIRNGCRRDVSESFAHEIQAESCTIVLLFRCKERFENLILDFEGNSGAGIQSPQAHLPIAGGPDQQ